jgi:uncharacterized protein (DUF58 family)
MVLLDESESMEYRSNPNGLSKLEYAQLIACSLGYLITAQHDSVGLATFTESISAWLRPASSPANLDDMIRLMEQPRNQTKKSRLSRVLQQCLDRLSKPNLIILLSDLLDDTTEVLRSFELLQLAGHDLLVLHVLDPWELSFPFDRTAEFVGLESIPAIAIDPLMIAGAYRRAMYDFCRELELGCLNREADYYRLTTEQSLAISLPQVLGRRSLRRK